MTKSDHSSHRDASAVEGLLAEADRLAGAGHGLQAIELLTEANRPRREAALEQRLVGLRHQIFATLPRRLPAEAHVEVEPDEPPGPRRSPRSRSSTRARAGTRRRTTGARPAGADIRGRRCPTRAGR